MTTSKTLLGLLIVAGGLGFYLFNQNSQDTEHNRLIAALSSNESSIDALDHILVTQGEQRYDMRERETGWVLNEGFYVRMDSLFQWVQALKDARLVERKTANPDNFQDLSLTEEDLRVQLYQGQQLLADVILGQISSTPGTRFVRYADDNQSWLASGLNDLDSSAEVWQLKMLFDVPANQVQAIEWTAADSLNLIKDSETGQWQHAEPTDAGGSLNQQKVQSLAAALSGFRIQQATQSEADLHQPQHTVVFGLAQGRTITLALFGDADKAILKVTDSQQPNRYQNWQFTVPEYKLDTLMMLQSEVIESKSEDTEDTEEQSAISHQTEEQG